jgi:transposase-like protein
MDPHAQFCHNRRCRAYGRSGEGHVVIHSQKERHYRCKRCGQTFCESRGTALYRVHKPKWLVLAVVTLLAYGCPVQAIVAAFDLDERTVARWQKESGLRREGQEGGNPFSPPPSATRQRCPSREPPPRSCMWCACSLPCPHGKACYFVRVPKNKGKTIPMLTPRAH